MGALAEQAHSTTFEEGHFRVKDAMLSKKQMQPDVIPPMTIAAKKDKTLQIAAKYARCRQIKMLRNEKYLQILTSHFY